MFELKSLKYYAGVTVPQRLDTSYCHPIVVDGKWETVPVLVEHIEVLELVRCPLEDSELLVYYMH